MTPQDQLPQLPQVQMDNEPPLTEEEGYWAARKAMDVLSVLKTKEQEYFDALERRGLLYMWRAMWAQYYGQSSDGVGFESQMISATGEDGELLTFRLQQVRPLIQRQIQMAVGERAAFQCHALNDDYATRAQINTCDSIIEYTYRESHAERKERDILEGDSNFGAAFGWCRWDPEAGDEVTFDEQQPIPGDPSGATTPVPITKRSGAPDVGVLYPWELIQDRAVKKHMWREARERTSRWELIAKYPELARKIKAIHGLDEYTTAALFGYEDDDIASDDDVIVKHFYHERCAALRDGRYIGFVGDVVLWDLPCPTSEGMPIVEMCSERFIGSTFGYASGWDLMAPNQLIDQITSDMASNLATFGRQVIGVYEGTEFDVDELANGHRVLTLPTNSQPPVPMNFAGIPESARWALEFLIRQMQSNSGINAVAMGDPQANISSGSMAALFHEIAVEFQGPRQTAFDEYREAMANLQLDMVRQRASAPFLIEVAGLEERPYLQEFTKDTLSGVRRVVVKTSNPMMRSQAGRLDIFNAVKMIQNPADRAAAIEGITTGNFKDFAKVERSEKMSIVWENEQLANGVDVPVSILDNPFVHFREHKAEFDARREALMTDSRQLATFLNHILQHQMVYETQMTPTIAEWLGIPPPPQYRMMMGPGGAPANTNAQPGAAPEGSMASGQATPAGAAAQAGGAGMTPSDPAAAAGVNQPSQPQPAQPPGGQAQNPGQAA